MTYAGSWMFSCSRVRAAEPGFHESLEGGTCIRHKADPAITVADRSKKPKIERAGPLRTTHVLASVVSQGTKDIAGLDHLAFGYEQVLERFKNVYDSVSTTDVKRDLGIGVNRAVVLRLGFGSDSGDNPGCGRLDGGTCRRHEVHPLVDAQRVLGGRNRRAHGAIISIHVDFGSVIEWRIQDERRI